MNKKELLNKLSKIRNKAYEFKGSYEDNYLYLMNAIDDLWWEIDEKLDKIK